MGVHRFCQLASQFVMLRQNYILAHHADVLSASSRVPYPLHDEPKERLCGRLKFIVPHFKNSSDKCLGDVPGYQRFFPICGD